MDWPWAVRLMQAPIGPASTPALVSAVSNAGALGTLAASWTDPATLRAEVRQILATTSAPFCLNFVLAFDQGERVGVALDEGVPVVSFSWGLDPALVRRARERGARVLVQVGSVREAVDAAFVGADAIIVQGVEAGGHVQSVSPVLELVREARRLVSCPIIAAGGIGDAEAARGAVEAGAAGVACGTVFLAADEADVHPHYLRRLIDASSGDTVLTGLFDGNWPGAAHRVLVNSTLVRWVDAGRPPRGSRPGEGDVVAHRGARGVERYDDAQPTRETTGDVDAMAMYAGLSVSGVQRAEAASDIVERIAAGLS